MRPTPQGARSSVALGAPPLTEKKALEKENARLKQIVAGLKLNTSERRTGFVGYVWSRLRADIYRLQYYNFRGLRILDANTRKTRD